MLRIDAQRHPKRSALGRREAKEVYHGSSGRVVVAAPRHMAFSISATALSYPIQACQAGGHRSVSLTTLRQRRTWHGCSGADDFVLQPDYSLEPIGATAVGIPRSARRLRPLNCRVCMIQVDGSSRRKLTMPLSHCGWKAQ